MLIVAQQIVAQGSHSIAFIEILAIRQHDLRWLMMANETGNLAHR